MEQSELVDSEQEPVTFRTEFSEGPGMDSGSVPGFAPSYAWGWVLVALAGALLRLYNLGIAPLSPAEAGEALGALLGEAASGGLGAASSGLLAGVNRVLFWLLGASDTTARLAPALVGAGLPLLMLLFVRQLGRRGALVAAGLLALSPSLVFISRNVSGLGLGVGAAVGLLGSLFRYQESGGRRWLLTAGAAAGLGLASGGGFLSVALPMAAATLISRSPDEPGLWDDLAARGPVLVGAGAAVLGSTALFFFPKGLGIMGDGLAQWLAGFGLAGERGFLAILPIYEPVILLFGLAALVWAFRRGGRRSRALAYWALGGLVLALFRPGEPDGVLALLVPLVLLIGGMLESLLGFGAEEQDTVIWAGTALAVTVLGVHILVNLGQYARRITFLPERADLNLLLAGVSAVLMVGVVVLVWTISQSATLRGVAIAGFVLLSAYGWGRAWQIGQTHQADPRELWVEEATGPGIRTLLEVLHTTSERFASSSYALPVTVQLEDPVLRWYLRDLTVTWVDSLQPGVVTGAVIAPEELETPLLGDQYMGMDLEIRLASPQGAGSASDTLRWLLLRDPLAGGEAVVSSRVVVWLRHDLTLAEPF